MPASTAGSHVRLCSCRLTGRYWSLPLAMRASFVVSALQLDHVRLELLQGTTSRMVPSQQESPDMVSAEAQVPDLVPGSCYPGSEPIWPGIWSKALPAQKLGSWGRAGITLIWTPHRDPLQRLGLDAALNDHAPGSTASSYKSFVIMPVLRVLVAKNQQLPESGQRFKQNQFATHLSFERLFPRSSIFGNGSSATIPGSTGSFLPRLSCVWWHKSASRDRIPYVRCQCKIDNRPLAAVIILLGTRLL